MKENIKLAWRNLWRNKRRTLITTASVFFGVILSVFLSSIQEGSYEQYVKAIVNSYSGYIQVHKYGFWGDKTINNLMGYNQQLKDQINKIDDITKITTRLESFALASSDEITKGVAIVGVNPLKEDAITKLSEKLTKGTYLETRDKGVVIGSTLAKNMKLDLNDTLVLISQGFHGMSATGKYSVRGIIKHPSPEIDKSVVYMDIEQCQEFFSANEMLTSVVIMVKDNNALISVQKNLEMQLGKAYEVMNWKEMNGAILNSIEGEQQEWDIIKAILYLIIGFGILSAVIMMMVERKKEFGILVSIGMQKIRLSCISVMETIMIGLIGVITGIIAGIPIIWYFTLHPIPLTGQAGEMMLEMGFEPVMSFSSMPSVFYNQAIIIFIFTLVIGLYPIYNINKLNITKALHS